MGGSRIILAAHRGDKFRFPENTMPAFKAAVEMFTSNNIHEATRILFELGVR